jgi:hypothetical protein
MTVGMYTIETTELLDARVAAQLQHGDFDSIEGAMDALNQAARACGVSYTSLRFGPVADAELASYGASDGTVALVFAEKDPRPGHRWVAMLRHVRADEEP